MLSAADVGRRVLRPRPRPADTRAALDLELTPDELAVLDPLAERVVGARY